MQYKRSFDIERRLSEVRRLIRMGGYSTRRIAKELAVSVPTVSRDVMALRERGHDIRSIRKNDAWQYELAEPTVTNRYVPQQLVEARQ